MTRKSNFFEGCFWFKFNDFREALGITVKFYPNMVIVLKLKVRKVLAKISIFVKVTGEKLVGEKLNKSWIDHKTRLDWIICASSYLVVWIYNTNNKRYLVEKFANETTSLESTHMFHTQNLAQQWSILLALPYIFPMFAVIMKAATQRLSSITVNHNANWLKS